MAKPHPTPLDTGKPAHFRDVGVRTDRAFSIAGIWETGVSAYCATHSGTAIRRHSCTGGESRR
jgi:hypothetical protein